MVDSQSSRPENNLLKLAKRFWKPATWLIAFALVGFTLSIAPLNEIGKTLANLGLWQILILFFVNIGIIFAFGLRWWWLLKVLGYSLPYRDILRYRLASFGVSYFTPGPQFGGEPMQVYYLQKYHGVPMAELLASLSLDKVLELLANFTFLAMGLILVLEMTNVAFQGNATLLVTLVGLLALMPWFYLVLLYRGRKVFASLSQSKALKMASRPKLQGSMQVLRKAENQMSEFCQNHPFKLTLLMILSALVWSVLVLEYWLALSFLGANLDLLTTLVFIVAARLAFLTPLPGGLGALELSQSYAAQSLGFGPELGVSIGLIIRARDIAFGLVGLLWGGILTRKF